LNYRELPLIAIFIAIIIVTLLTVIYMPHVRALVAHHHIQYIPLLRSTPLLL